MLFLFIIAWMVKGRLDGLEGEPMLRNTRLQMMAVLAIGALGGYLAASGRLNPFQKADAAPTANRAETGSSEKADCCSEGATRGQLLALANTKAAAAEGQNGKKPNIVFIMGDDVGWFNIGAYHQGIMAGKTPNLDKLASQGMRFTDYYAE